MTAADDKVKAEAEAEAARLAEEEAHLEEEAKAAEEARLAARPVYDERGNVRPRGTPGARYRTKAERVKIAEKLNAAP